MCDRSHLSILANPQLKMNLPEHNDCVDCGVNTHPGAAPRELVEMQLMTEGASPVMHSADQEVYMVRDKVWRRAGMGDWDGCLCIGCLEKRLGRRLRPKDFMQDHPFMMLPGTDRLLDRRGGGHQETVHMTLTLEHAAGYRP